MKEETKSGVSTISLGRLQYIRWVTAGPTQKTKMKTNSSTKLLLTYLNTHMARAINTQRDHARSAY
jgi:hypothetical protein